MPYRMVPLVLLFEDSKFSLTVALGEGPGVSVSGGSGWVQRECCLFSESLHPNKVKKINFEFSSKFAVDFCYPPPLCIIFDHMVSLANGMQKHIFSPMGNGIEGRGSRSAVFISLVINSFCPILLGKITILELAITLPLSSD